MARTEPTMADGDPKQYLALEFGGTHIVCAAVSGKSILGSTTLHPEPGTLLSTALHLVERQLRVFTEEFGSFAGIGMGFCGLVDTINGRISSTNGKYDDGANIDLPRWAERQFSLPFRIENDVRLALLGEHRAGAARGCDNAVLMTIGTGIGTAALMEGRILRGKHSQAGILGGHFKIPGSLRSCSCGGVGCYEAQGSTVSLPGFCASWPGFDRSALKHVPWFNFAELFSLADRGDSVSCQIREFCMETWSACAVSLIHAYDPELVLIGGGVLQNDFPILSLIRDEVHRQAWTPWGKVRVEPMKQGRNAPLFGVAALFGDHS